MTVRRHARWPAIAAMALAFLSIFAAPAAAHSDLASSEPADGSTIEGPVDEVTLVFGAPIDFAASSFEAIDASGAERPIADTSIAGDGVTVTIVLAEPVVEGVVGVGYTIVAGDSHPRTGFVTFGVTAPPPTPTPEPTPTAVPEPTATTVAPPSAPTPTAPPPTATTSPTPTPTPTQQSDPAVDDEDDDELPDLGAFLGADPNLERMVDAQTAFRGLGYGAGVVLVGGLVFFSLVAGRRPDRPARLLLVVAAVGSVVSGVALIALQAGIADAGDTGALIDPSAWADGFRGNFAVGTGLRIAGGGAALAILGAGGAPALAAASAVALSFPFLGHGVSRDPSWLVFPADLVHVVAVAIWTGGLAMLLLTLRSRRGQSLSAATHGVVEVVNRYSAVAGAAVAAAAITGTVLAATELDGPGALVDTSYGKRLVVKLVFVAALVALGGFHRYRVIPRINAEGAESPATRKLLVAGAVEVAIMGLVVLVTALLVNAAT